MRYLTARKRAEGKGAAGTGTEHHWYMTVSAIGQPLIVPLFLYIFGSTLGGSYEEVTATFSRPVPAVLTALVLVFGLQHYLKGFQTMVEDYWRGTTKKAAIIFMTAFVYGLMAFGLYALAKMAL
jgi:succinate dehydrogenase / fumarate reductase membrane anchor subunit